MGRAITRRDFLHGVGATLVATAAGTPAASSASKRAPRLAPPLRTGLRGSHAGSFESAHQLVFGGRDHWGPARDTEDGLYDLVVVGAGVSGLAAAWFYRREHPGARVLVLDNHDDFGGHAKRNEFQVGRRTILGYGGSQSLEAPGSYSDVARQLLVDIGVDTSRFETAYDQSFYERNGLGAGIYFDRASYGVDKIVRGGFLDPSAFLPVAKTPRSNDEAIEEMPLSEAARVELKRLFALDEDRVPEESIFGEPRYLRSISYRDFLARHLGTRQPEVFALLQDTVSSYFGIGIDGTAALDAMLFGLPGLGGTSLGSFESLIRGAVGLSTEPYIYHFPDGNASIARLLVRELNSRVTPTPKGRDPMANIVTAPFDYAELDDPGADVRIRLGSTAIEVAHEGNPKTAERVAVTYVRDGRALRVRASRCVLACYNSIIPYLCPELPAPQKEALSKLIKSPLVYTNVVLRSWNAVKAGGVAIAHCPGSWHTQLLVDFPVSLGDYHFSGGPDEPILVNLNRQPLRANEGLSAVEQFKAGRRELLTTPFETIEYQTRLHLAGMWGAHGFDPARDILAITANRWPHGYAYGPEYAFDEPDVPESARPWVVGRQRFGRIAIANSDAGGRAYLDCAIDEAHRAVGEIS